MRRTLGLALAVFVFPILFPACGLIDKITGKDKGKDTPEKVEDKPASTTEATSSDTAAPATTSAAATDTTATPAASGEATTEVAATDPGSTAAVDTPPEDVPDSGTASNPPTRYDGGLGTGTTPCLQRCQMTLRSCVGGGQGFDATRCHANFNACQQTCFH